MLSNAPAEIGGSVARQGSGIHIGRIAPDRGFVAAPFWGDRV
jgi:hypothetical protein